MTERLRTERAQDHLRQAKVTKPAVDAIEGAHCGGRTTIATAPHPSATRIQVSNPGGFPPVNNGDPKTGDLSTTDTGESRLCECAERRRSAVTVLPSGRAIRLSAGSDRRRRSRRFMAPSGTRPRTRHIASAAPEARIAGVTVLWGANSSVTTNVPLRCRVTYQPFAYPSISLGGPSERPSGPVALQPAFRLSPRTSQNGCVAPWTSSLAEVAVEATTRTLGAGVGGIAGEAIVPGAG